MKGVAVEACRSFRIEVSASRESNDHQVRFMADGQDLISRFWKDMLGLDPDEILLTPCPLLPAEEATAVTIARCSCGVVECGSEAVRILRQSGAVEWGVGKRPNVILTFPAADYEREVLRALSDSGWETPDRTAARLVRTGADMTLLRQRGYGFGWASGRVRDGFFTVSLMQQPGPCQVLVHVPWVGERPQELAIAVLQELSQPPGYWRDVEWSPVGEDVGVPRDSGRGWRRKTTRGS